MEIQFWGLFFPPRKGWGKENPRSLGFLCQLREKFNHRAQNALLMYSFVYTHTGNTSTHHRNITISSFRTLQSKWKECYRGHKHCLTILMFLLMISYYPSTRDWQSPVNPSVSVLLYPRKVRRKMPTAWPALRQAICASTHAPYVLQTKILFSYDIKMSVVVHTRTSSPVTEI